MTTKCTSGWYNGHRPKEPNDDCRTICMDCRQPLVKYGFTGRWKLDRTQKRFETLQKVTREMLN